MGPVGVVDGLLVVMEVDGEKNNYYYYFVVSGLQVVRVCN